MKEDITKDIVDFEPKEKWMTATIESDIAENEETLRRQITGWDGEPLPHVIKHEIDGNGNYRSTVIYWKSDLGILGFQWKMKVRPGIAIDNKTGALSAEDRILFLGVRNN